MMRTIKIKKESWQAAVAMVGTTILLIYTAYYIRSDQNRAPLSLMQEAEYFFDPYVIGLAVQEFIVPLALFSLLGTTRLFQHFVTEEKQTTRQTALLFGSLALIQLLFFSYIVGLNLVDIDAVSLGLIVAAVGGLLGGWRVGLALGLMAGLWRGGESLFFDYLDEPADDWWSETEALEIFWWYFVTNLTVLAPIWAGYVAGHGRTLLGRYRFNPLVLIGVGVVLELIPSWLTAYGWNEVYRVEWLLPAVVVTGLSLGAFGLIVRNVQGNLAQRRAEAAALALTQAELSALRAQINPHFLFNSLNTIRYLVRTDPDGARDLLLRLSDVFQNALKSGDFIPLKEEIHYTKSYLALEQARLEERLEVVWFVQTESLLERPVPTLILQPIVENGIVHGIAPQTEGGKLQITIRQSGDDLLLEVVDNGRGISAEQRSAIKAGGDQAGGGVGLSNINGRLQALYGAEYGLMIESAVGQGTTVQMRIPRSKLGS